MTKSSSAIGLSAKGQPFGMLPNGNEARLFTLENDFLCVRITDYGGRIVSILVPDRLGRREEVVLGFNDAAAYAKADGSFGALLGRDANRIAHGTMVINGQRYSLSKNENGLTTLHGGADGFENRVWKVDFASDSRLALSLVSPDGDQGFPGELSVKAIYDLCKNGLSLSFEAFTTRTTPVSLSAHPYFNLGGPEHDSILDHCFCIGADCFLPTDTEQIPTGARDDVVNTPFDWRSSARLKDRIREGHAQLGIAKGFDHYFILNSAGCEHCAAHAIHPDSGRSLQILTSYPGLQFYSGNNLDGSVLGRNGFLRQSSGFSFEPQNFPNAVNEPRFPSALLAPGARYSHQIEYRFSIASGLVG